MTKAWLACVSCCLALALFGCGSGGPSSGAGATTAPSSDNGVKKIQVGIVFDVGGKNDKGFNQSAYEGLQRATRDLGIVEHDVESRSEKDISTNLEAMAEQGYDLIFAVGFSQSDALKDVATKFPNIKFAIVDGTVDLPNVRSLHFAEEQGSFLAGYLAGLMTKTNKVGFVGGMEIPLILKFQYGYQAGALTSNPKVQILPAKFTNSWADVDLGKTAGDVLFASGADIVYHAAGKSGIGVIEAAKDAGKYAIGVDMDQDSLEPGSVLTSMVKRVDVAVYETTQDLKEGTFTAGTKVYDLGDGGVGLSPMTYTKDKIGAKNLKAIEAVSFQITGGKIKVPYDEATYNAYIAGLKKGGA